MHVPYSEVWQRWADVGQLTETCRQGKKKIHILLYDILYTVSTQQHPYRDIMYAIVYTVATCFDRKRSSSGR